MVVCDRENAAKQHRRRSANPYSSAMHRRHSLIALTSR